MNKLRRVFVSMLLSMTMSQAVAAEDMKIPFLKLRGSAVVDQKQNTQALSACTAGRMLGLCAAQTASGLVRAARALGNKAMFTPEEESIPLLPKNLTKVVKLFMEDMEVAQVGNFKVKLKVSFE